MNFISEEIELREANATLIEHSKNTQELIDAFQANIRELEADNKRLLEALEFYANEVHWMVHGASYCSQIENDCGHRARKALRGEEE